MNEEFVEIQDNKREHQLIDLFKLKKINHKRIGIDARLKVLSEKIDFELKSTTTGSVSTARGLHLEHLERWKDLHWIIGKYNKKAELECCYYGSPDDMIEWITFWENDIKRGINISDMLIDRIDLNMMYEIFDKKKKYNYKEIKFVFKNLYTVQEYKDMQNSEGTYDPEIVLEMFKKHNQVYLYRGAALNNPKIPFKYYKSWPRIDNNFDKELRRYIKRYLKSKQ